MLNQRIFRLGEDTAQGFLIQRLQRSNDGQTAYDFWYQPKFLKIGGGYVSQYFILGYFRAFSVFETYGPALNAARNDFLNAVESTTANEKDVAGVNLHIFLFGVLSATFGSYVGYGSLQNFQQALLNAFSAHIAGNGGIIAFAADFVYFIQVDDAFFGCCGIVIGHL